MTDLTQAGAEAVGWTFDQTTELRVPAPVDVPIYNATKFSGQTYIVKTFESRDALLADITSWEQAQPTSAPVEAAPEVEASEDEAAPVAQAAPTVSSEPVSALAPDPVPDAAPAATDTTPTEGA